MQTVNNQQSKRFLEKILLGQDFSVAPIITSRICGKNSIEHQIASIIAIEKACDITSTSQTNTLRQLILSASIIKNHTTHLIQDILPLLSDSTSLSSLKTKHPETFDSAKTLQQFSDSITKSIGGRTTHPISLEIGGFKSYPTNDQLKDILKNKEKIIGSAKKLVKVFASFNYFKIDHTVVKIAVHNNKFLPILDGDIWTSYGKIIEPISSPKFFLEEIHPRSDLAHVSLKGDKIQTGPIARFDLNTLSTEVKDSIKDLKITIDTNNPFHNVIVSALENYQTTIYLIDALENITKNDIKKEPIKQVKKFDKGASAIETVAGTLIHSCSLDKNGKIIQYHIFTPEMFNLDIIREDQKNLAKISARLTKTSQNKMFDLLFQSYNFCPYCASK